MSHRVVFCLALCALSSGCFPDETLRPYADATVDLGAPDVTAGDGSVDVSADRPAVDAGFDASADATADVPVDANRCASVPRDAVPSMALWDRLPDGVDVAFDGTGHALVASLRDVVDVGAMGKRTLRFTGLAGNVTGLRFTASQGLALALAPTTTDGTIAGGAPGEHALFVAPWGDDAGAPVARVTAGRIGGLAVDGDDTVWFSDTLRNRVFRVVPRTGDAGVDVVPMVVDVSMPTRLAFDGSGRVLYVASSAQGGSVYRVVLQRTVMGDLMPMDARLVLRDAGTVSGLAVDQCDHVYVADEAGGRVLRTADPWGAPTVLVRDVPGARALAFGRGGTYGDDTLLFFSGGSLRVASVGAAGVALPTPAR